MIKNKEIFHSILLFLIAAIINQYFGNRGLFPHDSASHFDAGYRILNGEHPIKDYWIISGFIVDYIQSLFFLALGINWQTYVLHASVFNGILTVVFFHFLRNLEVDLNKSLFFCICFCTLAYTSSGTPFVDHHSSFFSLLAILYLILALNFRKKFYWFIIPVLLALSFLSKPVPASYFIIFIAMIIFFNVLSNKDYDSILPITLGSTFSTIFFLLLLKINNIGLTAFYDQYFLYPKSIGGSRFKNLLNINPIDLLLQYKFIFLSVFIIIILNIYQFKKNKDYLKNKKLFNSIIISVAALILIFHQTLTKNQIFIYFIIPVLLGFSFSLANLKKIPSYTLILLCLILTFKYHLRFNHERKFHELTNVDFKLSEPARQIDNKLIGLKWITPQRPNDPKEEILEIKEIKNILLKNENFALLTNYSFFSAILEKKTSSPTRWFTFDGTDFPRENNEFKIKYKNLFLNNIKKNNIEKIFIIEPVKSIEIYQYIDKSCFKEKEYLKNLVELKIIPCKDIKF